MNKLARLAIALAIFAATPAQAAVLTYSTLNFDGGPIYESSGNWIGTLPLDQAPDTFRLVGAAFVPSVSGVMVGFDVGMYNLTDTSHGALTWSLHTADGTSPDLGEALWSQDYSAQLGDFGSVASFGVDDGQMLIAGQAYWLVIDVPLTDGTFVAWNISNTGDLGDRRGEYTSNRPGQTFTTVEYDQGQPAYAFSVSVRPVPLPAGAYLLGSALLALGAAKRRAAKLA